MVNLIYMAAGNSRRFLNANKLLVALEKMMMFEHGLSVFEEVADADEECRILVVTRFSEIMNYCERKNIDAVYNPSSMNGLSFTIKAAIDHLNEMPDGIKDDDLFLFMIADQPNIKADTVKRLIETARNAADFECASVYFEDTPGSPAIFSAKLIPELMELSDDEGGRKVIRRHKELRVLVEDESELLDVDTREDLKR